MKKLIFALIAVVIAVGGSAFTNAKRTAAAGSIYGSTSTNYTLRTTTVYDNDDCLDNVSKLCAYQVTTTGASIVTQSSYTNQEMVDFRNQGYVIELSGDNTGIYTAP